MTAAREWIDDLEIENANIKWSWSNFDGRPDSFDSEGGKRYFVVILPGPEAVRLRDLGWSIKENDPYEEGDEPEFTMKVYISYRFDPPGVYLIKNGRKIRAEESDVSDIRRDVCENIDLVISPKPWEKNGRSGVSAYVKELYASIRVSRFGQKYEDYEAV